jgi:hypothetical protein
MYIEDINETLAVVEMLKLATQQPKSFSFLQFNYIIHLKTNKTLTIFTLKKNISLFRDEITKNC